MSETTENKSVDAGTVVEIGQLANALRFEKAKNEVLLGEVVSLEDEVVNRSMAEFDAVVSDETREFWREQLLSNRAMAEKALSELARAKQPFDGAQGGNLFRRPLHNRALSRPIAPTTVGGGGIGGANGAAAAASEADDRAAKIRNRAHEISRADRVPFSVAFRRAEREVGGQ